MPAYKFPVCIWQDREGVFTGCLVEDTDSAAVSDTLNGVLEQLEELLRWQYAEDERWGEPDLPDAQLLHLHVQVRPEYIDKKRVYACSESINLRVTCAYGKEIWGDRVAVLPLLGLRFYYSEESTLKEMVTHYVRQALKGKTPRDVLCCLPPAAIELQRVVVQVNEGRKPRRKPPGYVQLEQAAESLSCSSLRKAFGGVWCREAAITDLIHRLDHEKANVILVGERGVGKTAVLAEAVRRIERTLTPVDDDDGPLERRRFWLTNAARLIAGMKYLGQWQERCAEIIGELTSFSGVLCIENLMDLVRVGGEGPLDSMAAFLLSYLEYRELRMVIEATPQELDACRRLLPGFVDLFQVKTIPAFDRSEVLTVLERQAAALEKRLHLTVEGGVPARIHHLFARFAPYEAFPGKAIAFMREAGERAVERKAPALAESDIVTAFVERTGLPDLFVHDELPLDPAEVERWFSERIIDQPAACRQACALVTTFKSGLNDPRRPLGVLLFCGPTGVGKTALAHEIARYFFGHGKGAKERLIQLDMSEYNGPLAAWRFLNNPQGQCSQWIAKIRQQPFSVLLLDEVEKADPEVFDTLLGICDEGRLSDETGRITTFRSAIIIMTTNLGATKGATIGFGDSPPSSSLPAVKAAFRPEFFNRLDAVIAFQPLAPSTIRAITVKELREVTRREGLLKRNLTLSCADSLVDELACNGFDTRYGARPLQRALETRVIVPLARYLLAHPSVHDCRLLAEMGEGGVVFHIV